MKKHSYFLLLLNDIWQLKVRRSSQHHDINKQEEESNGEPSENFSTEQCGTKGVYLFPGDASVKEKGCEEKYILY